MSDLLKEAIADAKAVRETALLNAKAALEEAFTPQLKSMLSAKLKEDEFDDEEEFPAEVPSEEGYHEDDEIPGEEVPGEEVPVSLDAHDEFGGEEVPGEEVPLDAHDEFGGAEVPGEEEDELDLEAIIRELEQELVQTEQDDAYDEKIGKTDASHLAEEDDAYPEDVEGKEDPKHVGGTIGEGEDKEDDDVEIDESVFTEGEGDDDDDDDETVDENNDVSSGIGTADNKQPAANANKASTEDPGDSTEVADLDGVAALKAENKEYKEAVSFLKEKLHEVNILNAKLLFTNKLFKSFNLNNDQKLKVVETFDRTQSTREIKLVYSTLCEQFSDNGSISRRKSITESASSAIGSTKPSKESRKVITEESQVADRFRKLAGLIK